MNSIFGVLEEPFWNSRSVSLLFDWHLWPANLALLLLSHKGFIRLSLSRSIMASMSRLQIIIVLSVLSWMPILTWFVSGR
jgi:hypothetical protein